MSLGALAKSYCFGKEGCFFFALGPSVAFAERWE